MTTGLTVELEELISLKRYVSKDAYKTSKSIRGLGGRLSKWRGRGMDFAEVRNYQPGDEIKNMEWKVTARTGKPHIKLYQEEKEKPVVILVDFNPSMYFGTRIAFKSVIAARLSALISWTVIKQGDKIGALIYSADKHHEFVPKARESNIFPILTALSTYTKERNKEQTHPRMLSDALLRLRRVVKPGSIIVMISDFYQMDADSERHLCSLSEHNDLLAYHICDPLELNPPKPAFYAISNGQQEFLLDTNSKQINQAYKDFCADKEQQIQNLCKRVHMQYTQATAQWDIAKLVRQTFPRRKHG
jgi:uncharacterized protein (DUF58 family)